MDGKLLRVLTSHCNCRGIMVCETAAIQSFQYRQRSPQSPLSPCMERK